MSLLGSLISSSLVSPLLFLINLLLPKNLEFLWNVWTMDYDRIDAKHKKKGEEIVFYLYTNKLQSEGVFRLKNYPNV